jgi:hypothetical protein
MATQHDIDDLLAKMSLEREKLLAALSALDERDAEWAPSDVEGEAQWSPKQQASHLTEMESAYRAWVTAGLERDDPDVTQTRGDPVAIPLEEAHSKRVEDHLGALRSQRERTLELIASMTPEQFDRTATHKWFGTLTLLQWLRSYYRHDRMHQDQIAGRDPDYKPRYAGGAEPDQRRGRVR